MLRGRASQPPMPQPHGPAAASNEVNYISAQVQQILALVLPEPVVTVLASISDLLYRLILGRTNEPPTYASTLLPPVLLVLVTYLSILFVYRSIKSMFSMLIFSLKWTVILGLVALLFAYHLGNGDVRQGAQAAAQNSEGITQQIGNTLRQYSAVQQVAPLLTSVPQQLAFATGTLPALQSLSMWWSGQGADQERAGNTRNRNRAASGSRAKQPVVEMVNPGQRDAGKDASQTNRFRGYRDVRPSRQGSPLGSNREKSFTDTQAKSRKSSSSTLQQGKQYDEVEALQAGVGDVIDRLSRFFGGAGSSVDDGVDGTRRKASRQ